jgi:hypothetical protein
MEDVCVHQNMPVTGEGEKNLTGETFCYIIHLLLSNLCFVRLFMFCQIIYVLSDNLCFVRLFMFCQIIYVLSDYLCLAFVENHTISGSK